MIKNKHISKITMLTCLMLGGIVNAQEFYTCVPKKNTIMNININNVDELAKAITKIGGVGGGGTNANQKKWQLITTIDLSIGKVVKDNISDKRIFDGLLEPGKYKFRLFLKNNKKDTLNIFQNIVTIDKNLTLYFNSCTSVWFQDSVQQCYNFVNSHNYNNNVTFIQNRNLTTKNWGTNTNIGIQILKLGSYNLFVYETVETQNNDFFVEDNDYNSFYKNIFRYSTLEIYKQMDN